MNRSITFDEIAFLGDSLTDTGAFFEASTEVLIVSLPPREAGYDRQFSNGDVYADTVERLLGLDGGTSINLAVGGATASGATTFEDFFGPLGLVDPNASEQARNFVIDLAGQVDRYLERANGRDLSDTAASVLIGRNDFDLATLDPATDLNEQALELADVAVTAALTQIGRLIDAGIGTLIFGTIRPSEFFPLYDTLPEGLKTAGDVFADAFNNALTSAVPSLTEQGVEVRLVDFNALYLALDADPTAFGFVDNDTSIILGSGLDPAPNPDLDLSLEPDEVAFFDQVHPTTAVHDVTAAFYVRSPTSDVTFGDDGRDVIFGGRHDDLVLAGDGNDRVFLGRGDDLAIGGLGDDKLVGGRGHDLLIAGSGNDRSFGAAGDDVIADGDSDDLSSGGWGNDVLIDGAGSDRLVGGRGDDLFVFTSDVVGTEPTDHNLVVGGAGYDTLLIRTDDPAAIDVLEGPFGTIHVAQFGLTAFGVEEVRIVGENDVPGDLTAFYDLLPESELWGLV